MLITDIGAHLLPSLRCRITVSLLALPGVRASRCARQDNPLQTEEQRQARELLNEGVPNFENGQYDQAARDFLRAKRLDPKLLNARL
ncbi:MAG: hypothetical protein DMG56_20820 [Acidobacteria bacterium]|nr:MAG: hypothetical protein DMG56_20820 [Acidobacteriota bacterium]PYU60775.1 MAG: hypothetical protein DMG55_09805 [Acidobacteriota bacterium]